MKLTRKRAIIFGILGMMLTGCSSLATNANDATSASSTASEIESKTNSENVTSVAENAVPQNVLRNDVKPELAFNAQNVLLPTYFPYSYTTEIAADIAVNKPEEYYVVYTYERGSQQIRIWGFVYYKEEFAARAVRYLIDDTLAATSNEVAILSWQRDNWTIIVQTLFQDELDLVSIKETINTHLIDQPLPSTLQTGVMHIDYTTDKEVPYIEFKWHQGKLGYEMLTQQTPIDAIDVINSLE